MISATLFYVAMGFKNTKIQIDEATRRKGICYGVEKMMIRGRRKNHTLQ